MKKHASRAGGVPGVLGVFVTGSSVLSLVGAEQQCESVESPSTESESELKNDFF